MLHVLRYATLGLTLLASTGCGLVGPEDSVGIAGIDDSRVYYAYWPKFTGFNILPSSLWQFDRETENSSRLREATRQSGLQAADGYYATEIIADDETEGRVVGGSLASGRTLTVHTRTLQPATSFPGIHVLSGHRLLVLADDELILADLAELKISKSIPLIDGPVDLVTFDGARAVMIDDAYTQRRAWIVDIATATWRELPKISGTEQPWYADAVLAGDLLATNRTEMVDDINARNEVLLFDLANNSWQVRTQYELHDPDSLFAPLASVRGLDDTYVLVDRIALDGTAVVEAIKISDGTRTPIVQKAVWFSFLFPSYHDGQVFWIDPTSRWLATYDISSADRHFARLQYPE